MYEHQKSIMYVYCLTGCDTLEKNKDSPFKWFLTFSLLKDFEHGHPSKAHRRVWLFLAVPWVCLQFVIVVFPDHTHYFMACTKFVS